MESPEMLPPTRQASASPAPGSPSKRPRYEESQPSDDSFVAASEVSAGSDETGFSAATKRRLFKLTDGRCWHCQQPDVAARYIISPDDKGFSDLKDRGLINLTSTADFENSVALCISCYFQFNYAPSAGFVFFPSDLNFFMQYEIRYRERGGKAALSQQHSDPGGSPTRRRCPSAAEYHQHQVEAGIVGPDDAGGLHERYMLYPFPFPPHGVGQVFAPAPWHGDPMTALRRAFGQVTALNAWAMPKETRKTLVDLLKLYSQDDAPEATGRGE